MSDTWSEVQRLNFQILTTLHETAREDLAMACCSFGVDRRAASAAAQLEPLQILQITQNLGDRVLFAVADLHAVLTTPHARLPVLACAYARRLPTAGKGEGECEVPLQAA